MGLQGTIIVFTIKKKCTRERWWEGTREWEWEHKDVEGESGGDTAAAERAKHLEVINDLLICVPNTQVMY